MRRYHLESLLPIVFLRFFIIFSTVLCFYPLFSIGVLSICSIVVSFYFSSFFSFWWYYDVVSFTDILYQLNKSRSDDTHQDVLLQSKQARKRPQIDAWWHSCRSAQANRSSLLGCQFRRTIYETSAIGWGEHWKWSFFFFFRSVSFSLFLFPFSLPLSLGPYASLYLFLFLLLFIFHFRFHFLLLSLSLSFAFLPSFSLFFSSCHTFSFLLFSAFSFSPIDWFFFSAPKQVYRNWISVTFKCWWRYLP